MMQEGWLKNKAKDCLNEAFYDKEFQRFFEAIPLK